MKHTLSLVLIMLLALPGVFAKDKERASKHTTVKGPNISVTYGQPSVKGRVIFGEKKDGALQPYGEIWRAGADEATEITIDKASLFAGRQLNAGTYTMFVIPGKTEWTIILNRELKQWGAFNYDKIKDKDIIQSKVPVTTTDKVTETFTITVKENGFLMEWEHVSAFVPVKPF